MKDKNKIPTGTVSRGTVAAKTAVKIGAKKLKFISQSPFQSSKDKAARKELQDQEMARELFEGLCKLRGTALKVAQLLCGQMELLPEAYRKELEKSQYRVPALNRAVVRKVIKQELGKDPEDLFKDFEAEAFAGASLGQVHRATAKDGRSLAVKIQYPGIDTSVETDLSLVKSIVSRISSKPLLNSVFKEVEANLLEEVDYGHELRNTQWFKDHLKLPFVKTPGVYPKLSSRYVLTQDFLHGEHLSEWMVRHKDPELRSQVAQNMYDLTVHCLYKLGVIHSDPNQGNYLIMPNADIGLIDFGSVKFVDDDSLRFMKKFVAYHAVDLDKHRDEILELYGDLGIPLKKMSKSERDALWADVVLPFMKVGARLFAERPFDFAKNNDFASENSKLLTQHLFTPSFQNFTPQYTLVHRTMGGLYHIFTRLGAKVKFLDPRYL